MANPPLFLDILIAPGKRPPNRTWTHREKMEKRLGWTIDSGTLTILNIGVFQLRVEFRSKHQHPKSLKKGNISIILDIDCSYSENYFWIRKLFRSKLRGNPTSPRLIHGRIKKLAHQGVWQCITRRIHKLIIYVFNAVPLTFLLL